MFTRPEREVDRVFLHCSASDTPEHDGIDVIRRWHVDDNGWDDVGYHYFIRRDGTLESGRPLEKTPAAQAGNNAATIAICLHGLRPDGIVGPRTWSALTNGTPERSRGEAPPHREETEETQGRTD